MVNDETYEGSDGPQDQPSESVSPTPVDKGVQGIKESVDDAIDPALAHRKKKSAGLRRKCKAKSMSPDYYDINNLSYLLDDDLPLRRRDLGNQALVLTADDFDTIFTVDVILKTGIRITYDTTVLEDEDDIFILYPDDLGNKEFEPVKNPSLRDCLDRLPDDFTWQIDTLLRDIFSDIEFDAVLEQNDAWDAIIKDEPNFERLLSKAREAGISDDYRKRFVCIRLREEIENGQYLAASAKLKIADMGTADQQASFASLATDMQSEFESARKKERYMAEARTVVHTLFADVLEGDRVDFVAQEPAFWNSLNSVSKLQPAERIRFGRKCGVPEKHLRRFALETLQKKLELPVDAWIVRFLTEMDYSTPEATAFFEERMMKKS